MNSKEMKSIDASADPKNRGKKRAKKDKNEINAAEPAEDDHVYSIDRPNMIISEYYSDSDSLCILAQGRKR